MEGYTDYIKESLVGGYLLRWLCPGGEMEIKITRIIDKDGSVKGDMRAYLKLNTEPPERQHLLFCRVNMMSLPERAQLASSLADAALVNGTGGDRPPKDITGIRSSFWYRMIEDFFSYIVAETRMNDPVLKLTADGSDMHRPEMLVDPFIVKDCVNVFYGAPGSLKTTMALAIGAIATGQWKADSLGMTVSGDGVRVLYLDWETSDDMIRWQLERIRRGNGLGTIELNYRRCSIPLHLDVESIQEEIHRTKSNMLMVDSIGLATGGELNDSITAIQFFLPIRQFNVTSLLLTHEPKDKKNQTIFGSAYFNAVARSVWHLEKIGADNEPELDLVMINTKAPPFMGTHSPIGFHLTMEDESIAIERDDSVTRVNFFGKPKNNANAVMDYLRDSGASSPKEISEATGININSVKSVLRRMVKAQKLRHCQEGKYELPDA